MTRPGDPQPGFLLLAGPPFGPELYRGVVSRLGTAEVASVLDPRAPDDGWAERGRAIARSLAARPTVLVAHGLAVPAAVAAALEVPPAALVLSNGPLRRVDAVAAVIARACGAPAGVTLLEHTLFHPKVWLSWLASSAGLRRAAANPYVMDRDTVAALCGPVVASEAGRRALAGYLRSLVLLPDPAGLRCPVLLLWGDGDPLYPAEEASFLEASLPTAAHVSVPGGQHTHPEERPWEMADRLHAWLQDQGISSAAATRMS